VIDLSPQRLSDILHQGDALASGKVVTLQAEPVSARGLVSDVARLVITYSPDATGVLPDRLFVKTARKDTHPEFFATGRHEVEFYRAAARLGGMPIPRCYAAEYDAEAGESLLITDDLTNTHFARPLPIPPSSEHCQRLIDALASLHGRFWESSQLGHSLGERMTADRAKAQTERLVGTLPAFFDFLGDALLPKQRAIYERIVGSTYLQGAYQRLIALNRVTLIHGDVHTGNVMLPREPDGDVKLIDWQLWDIGIGAHDLAFLIALHWSRARRALLERPLLERYHAKLLEAGVPRYAWADFFDDYRRAVATMLLIPIGQFRRKMPNGVIWFGLQDATAAFEDLGCEEVLES